MYEFCAYTHFQETASEMIATTSADTEARYNYSQG